MSASTRYSQADVLGVIIGRHYLREHGACVVSVGNAPKWDLRFQDGCTCEVKVDQTASRTMNAAVEFWNARKDAPSGILATEAKLHVFCVPEGDALRCFEMDTKRLLKLCLECGEVKWGGDYSASCLKIIPLQRIREIANEEFLLRDDFIVPMILKCSREYEPN